MTRIRNRRRAALAAALATVLTAGLTSCGLESGGSVPFDVGPGTVHEVPELKDVAITVGGKDFTEQVILTYLAEGVLQAAGMKVRDMGSLSGSNSFRQALVGGEIDTGIEYTGTAWISYLGNEKPLTDPTKQWEAVRDADATHGLAWLPSSTVDNTYALASNQDVAQRTGVRTLSQYRDLVTRDPAAARTCLDTEFRVRRDGYPGMAAKYGFDPARAQVSILQVGIIYQATAKGDECSYGVVYTTDGRIKGLNLVALEDDKQFFPHYNAAPVIRQELLDAHPQIAQVYAPLMAALDNRTMMDLNASVDIDGKDPAVVARDFLVAKGLVSAK